jgi:hypothetical protein
VSCGHAFSGKFAEAIQTLGRLATRSSAPKRMANTR